MKTLCDVMKLMTRLRTVSEYNYQGCFDQADYGSIKDDQELYNCLQCIADKSLISVSEWASNDTLTDTFNKTALAYDEEMECTCKYIARMDKLNQIWSESPGDTDTQLLLSVMDASAHLKYAKEKREQMVDCSDKKGRARRGFLNNALLYLNMYSSVSEAHGDKLVTSVRKLRSLIHKELKEIEDGVPLSRWYIGMSHLMNKTRRPFFSLIEWPRHSGNKPTANDKSWTSYYNGLTKEDRWTMYLVDKNRINYDDPGKSKDAAWIAAAIGYYDIQGEAKWKNEKGVATE